MATKISKMMGSEEREDQEEQEEWVPRALYTIDAKPDFQDFQISLLRLAQGTTPEVTERKAQIGQYVITNFEPEDEVTLVPFAVQKIRYYKPDPKARAQCKAPTGVFGKGVPGGPCDQCPLSKWGPKDPATGASKPPPCTEAISMRAYSTTHGVVVDFEFKNRSISKGQFIAQQAMRFGYGNFAVKMMAEKASNNRGNQWYTPRLQLLSEIPEADKDLTGRWFQAFVETTPTMSEAVQQLAIGEEN